MVSFIVLLVACSKFEPAAPAEEDLLDGPIAELTNEQNALFLKGDANVNKIFTSKTGLGPVFVSTNCISCHAGDGKGNPFTSLTRFGQSDNTGNQFLHLGGPQLQNRAIPSFEPENLPNGAPFTKLIAPAFTGLGFLQAVSDQAIIALSDPNDIDNDGISGVPSWNTLPATIVPNDNAVIMDGKYLHRFGKKASSYNLLHQTANAYNQDMGITSIFSPIDTYSGLEIDAEVSTQEINEVVHYLKTLKAPIQRKIEDAQIILGKNLFVQAKCGSCHVPKLQTSFSPIEALNNKVFYPYTDLLLHDMGSELNDGYTEGSATAAEWRTPALWGLGLSPGSQGGRYFLMHDGRANSIEAAIIIHGGEATVSKNNYLQLSKSDKEALIKFLESL